MNIKHLLFVFCCFVSCTFTANARNYPFVAGLLDTVPLKERFGDYLNTPKTNIFDLKDPSFIQKSVDYDAKTGQYIITEKIGDEYFRMPTYMTFKEYLDYKEEQQELKYFQKLNGVGDKSKGIGLKVDPMKKLEDLIQKNVVDRLFGGSEVSIIPQGNIDLTLGARYQNQKNPTIPVQAHPNTTPDFQMDIQVAVTGKIGEKLNINTNYNNKAAFNFDNQLKLNYDTPSFSEDEIIKDIDAGNVSLPLKSTLIQGASSLFGLKVESQFGKLRLTTVLAQQQSRRQDVKVQQGGQKYEFNLGADQYDENRHFFLTHINRENYEGALKNLPQINSLFAVTYLEVWVTNDRTETQNIRDIVAFTDLAEPDRIINTKKIAKKICEQDIYGKCLPTNGANSLYEKLLTNDKTRNFDAIVRDLTRKGGDYEMQQTRDFEKVRARKLRNDEFTFDPKLGYISVNFQLRPNQVLGVAFTYKYNGKEYKVGELSNNAPATQVSIQPGTTQADTVPQMLFVKLLKGTTPRLDIPLWDLMMKNIYSLGASNVNKENFRLDIMYNKPGDGERRFLPDSKVAGVPLLRVFNLDKLNVQGDPQPDGVFDFVEGVTINTRQGKIIFPVLEPFGKALSSQIGDLTLSRKYVYQQLYDTTITAAREFPELNVFSIKGEYKGSSNSEIQLGTFNLPKGSVKVTAGAQQLTEGTDYEINYSSGTVKILNEAYINSTVPLNVSFEDSQLFGFQQKRMVGTRWDYTYNKNLAFGGTFMKLWELPYTQKVNLGEDPVNNNIYGVDLNYNKDAPWITKAIDRLPFLTTKAPSSVSFTAEGAYLDPGISRAIKSIKDGNDNIVDQGGVVYIDDFEGSTNGTTLIQPQQWVLASIPQNDLENNNPRFPESDMINSTLSNVNRAKFMWYVINEQGTGGFGGGGSSVRTDDDNKNPYYGYINDAELFPRKDQGGNSFQGSFPARLFDLSFKPTDRGPYNLDPPNGTQFSAGWENNGRLKSPEKRWGGIMRALPYNDFEASNVEFIDMWILSPYLVAGNEGIKGKLHIDLGNTSEDILRDSRQFYENGLPGGTSNSSRLPTDKTKVARVPRITPITNAFDLDNAVRSAQDVGLDGWSNGAEQNEFVDYVKAMELGISPSASTFLTKVKSDPSNDDFKHFLDSSYKIEKGVGDGISKRYYDFNNTENNSQPSEGLFVNSSTNIPDSEDLDNNKSLDNEGESYFHYEIDIKSKIENGNFVLDNPYIVDVIKVASSVKGRWTDANQEVVFYRVRIPIDQFAKKVGGIQDFRSIRFMRMYMTDFEQPVVLRFAKLELARSQWRRYKRNKWAGADLYIDPGTNPAKDLTTFDVNSINFEENGDRPNFNYILPPGIRREQILGQTLAQLQNEQSISMSACNLQHEAERGIYKILNLDMRLFKRLKMFIHAEAKNNTTIKDGEATAFIRLGNDFERNYYEYEIPLVMSDIAALGQKGSIEYAREIWRKENNLDINLELFKLAKEERNRKGVSFARPYTIVNAENGKDSITIKGNPNLGNVRSMMIGVRNRTPSGAPICTEIWVNELRVNGFDQKGGGAALARADVKLADLGRVTVSGNYTGIGWGGIEDRQQQRSREQTLQYDVTTNLELGKFLPEKSGVKIPFTYQYSNNTKSPQFDPYDLDLTLKRKLAAADPSKRDSLNSQAVTANRISNMSFDNVRVERKADSKRKPMPWNISNFSVSYQQTSDRYNDPIIENENKTIRRGQLDYTYNIPNGLNITPLKKAIKKDKYLKLFSEFNFSPLPSSLSFNTNLERHFNTTKYRFTDGFDSLSTYYNKRFAWDRKYNMNWDLSKGIKLTYSADAESVIDEPQGLIDTQQKRDSIFTNIKNLGRYKVYNQNFGLNYTLPTKQIPLMDWISVRAQAQATYNWNAAALNTQFLGNTIRNTQSRQINGDFNFENLYNQWKYLKKINTPKGTKPKVKKTRETAAPKSMQEGAAAATDGENNGRGSKSDRSSDAPQPQDQREILREKMRQGKKTEKSGEKTDDKAGVKDGEKVGEKTADGKPMTAAEKKEAAKKKAKEKKKEYEPSQAERMLIRPLMLVRKARASYTETYQNTVPGFMPNTGILGQDNFQSPGWDFILGQQPTDTWLDNAAQKGWITESNLLNESVVRNYSQVVQGNVTIEPFTDFRVEVDLTKNYQKNHTQDFKKRFSTDPFAHLAPRDVGSYTISYFNMTGLFGDSTQLFNLYDNFGNYRKVISARLAGPGAKRHDSDLGYYEGYGKSQPEVVIPAFVAAYTGKDPNTSNLNIFKTMPLPNYKLSYNGLQKLPRMKEIFQSVNITHAYRAQLQVNSYNTNAPDFDREQPFRKDPITNSYYARLNIPGVVMNREFSPLIGLDVKLKNEMSFRVDVKKRYNLQMGFTDGQLSELRQDDYTIGFGYKMKNVHLKFLDFLNFEEPKSGAKKKKGDDDKKEKKKSIIKFGSDENKEEKPELDKNGKPIKKKKKKKGNDLILKCDVTIQDNTTYQTRLEEGNRIPVRGEYQFKISPSMDYTVNKQLTLRFFMDYNHVTPKISSSFPRTNVNGGLTLRFQLQ